VTNLLYQGINLRLGKLDHYHINNVEINALEMTSVKNSWRSWYAIMECANGMATFDV